MKEYKSNRFLKHNYYYFDTNSINKLVKNMTIGDCIATRELIKRRKKVWAISPLNLYEIFSTKNKLVRDEILHKVGHLFPSPGVIFDIPTRILFGEVLSYFTDSLVDSEKKLRKTWFEISYNPENVYFDLDYQDFQKRRDILKMFTNSMNFIIKNDISEIESKLSIIMSDLEKIPGFLNKDLVKSGEYLVLVALDHIISDFPSIEKTKKNYVKIILVYSIFCWGIEPDSVFLENYWSSSDNDRNQIHGVLDRFYYLMKYHEESIFKSPILDLMVDFIIHESTNKGIGRGTLADSIHLLYSYYCFYFVTDDGGIIDFSKTESFLKDRVFSVSNNFTFQGRYYLGNNIFYKLKFWFERVILKNRINKKTDFV